MNRTAEVFSDPDRLMIERPAYGRRVLSLGGAIQFCLGASLVMLEIKPRRERMFACLPGMRITNLDDVCWYPSNAIRRVASPRFAYL
jgi:cytochrome P450